MKNLNPHNIGGTVLKKSELLDILDLPNTVGLAFLLSAPGFAPNVDLSIVRVYLDQGQLKGEVAYVFYKKGAAGPTHYPAMEVEAFQFHYLDQLEQDGFYFGFYSKEKFNLLLKEEFDEVFIGGGKKDFPYLEKSTWFTFSIYLRKSINIISLDTFESDQKLKRKLWLTDPCQLPYFTDNVLNLKELVRRAPLNLDGSYHVDTIITNGESKLKGLILKEDDILLPFFFHKDQAFKSLSFTSDYTLIGSRSSKMRTTLFSDGALSNLMNLGVFPNEDLTDPCPPYWHKNGGSAEEISVSKVVKRTVNNYQKVF